MPCKSRGRAPSTNPAISMPDIFAACVEVEERSCKSDLTGHQHVSVDDNAIDQAGSFPWKQ